MKAWISLFTVPLLVGCAHPQSPETTVVDIELADIETRDVDLTDVPVEGDGVHWFSMTKHSGLYRDPAPPPDMNRAQVDDFIRGYRMGWKDEADDYIVEVMPGYDSLILIHVPASFHDPNATPAFSQGETAGRQQARQDFKTFCRMLEGKLDH